MVYVDTSVAVALFVLEVKTPQVKDWFAACADPLISADWILTEFASALSIKERRGEIPAGDSQALWAEFVSFCGTGLRLVPASRKSFQEAARLVRDATSGLRAGDALHLAVALETGASSIATADGVLDANTKKLGLSSIRF